MEVKVNADSIRHLVDAGMAEEVASEIKRLEEENRKLRIISRKLREMIPGDNFWTIESDILAGKPANKN